MKRLLLALVLIPLSTPTPAPIIIVDPPYSRTVPGGIIHLPQAPAPVPQAPTAPKK